MSNKYGVGPEKVYSTVLTDMIVALKLFTEGQEESAMQALPSMGAIKDACG